MDRAVWQEHLAQTERHIVEAEKRVARQREIVADPQAAVGPVKRRFVPLACGARHPSVVASRDMFPRDEANALPFSAKIARLRATAQHWPFGVPSSPCPGILLPGRWWPSLVTPETPPCRLVSPDRGHTGGRAITGPHGDVADTAFRSRVARGLFHSRSRRQIKNHPWEVVQYADTEILRYRDTEILDRDFR
jgi:hypothetical protein